MMFNREFYHNTISDWGMAVAIALVVYIVMRFGKAIVQRRLSRLVSQTVTEWDDMALALLERIHGWFLLVLSVYVGLRTLFFPETVSALLTKGIFLTFLFQAALIGSHTITFLINRYRRLKIESNAAAVTTLTSVGFVLQLLLWLILLLVTLDNFGVNVTTLIAGLGISGIAVALAVQNVLGDLFASFSIVFDKPFVIGDFIVVDDYPGTVEYVGLKTTRIRSLSGEQLIFANGDLLQSRIRNFKRMQERRVVFSIGVLYQTTYEQLTEIPGIIRASIERHGQVRFDRAHFKEYGAFALNFEVVYWIEHPDYTLYMDIQQAVNLSIFEKFADRGIRFAYPTQTLFIEKDSTTTTV